MTGLYPLVNRIRTPEGKGDLWLRVGVSEYEGHKQIGERWAAENTIILVSGSVHNATGLSVEFTPVGPTRCFLISQQRKEQESMGGH